MNRRMGRAAGIGVAFLLTAGLLYALRNALIPVVAALVLAYLLDPVIDRLQARGLKRSAAIFVLAGLLVLFLFGAGAFLLLQGQREVEKVSKVLPGYLAGTTERLERLIEKYSPVVKRYTGYELPATVPDVWEDLRSQLPSIDPDSLKPLSRLGQRIFASTFAFLSWVAGLLIIPVFLFYFLRDWDQMKWAALEYVPHSYRGYVLEKAGQIDEIVGAFIRGQLTLCLILGLLYSLGLMIVGIDLAVVIGMSAGLLFIVPYLGTIIGVVAASIMALLAYGLSWQLVGVWAVFGLVQLLEGTVLTPRIMGQKVGLPAVAVIFALLVGADLLGLLGMLLAVPAAAVIKVFVADALGRYRHSAFFLEKSQLPLSSSAEKNNAPDL